MVETSEIQTRVRYAETDQMGLVYHANYYVWFEMGRTEHFRLLGLPYVELEAEGVFLPVVETFCQYKAPARYDDLLTIRTTVGEIGAARISFSYQVLRPADGRLLAEGRTVHAFVDEEGRPINIRKKAFYQKLMAG